MSRVSIETGKLLGENFQASVFTALNHETPELSAPRLGLISHLINFHVSLFIEFVSRNCSPGVQSQGDTRRSVIEFHQIFVHSGDHQLRGLDSDGIILRETRLLRLTNTVFEWDSEAITRSGLRQGSEEGTTLNDRIRNPRLLRLEIKR